MRQVYRHLNIRINLTFYFFHFQFVFNCRIIFVSLGHLFGSLTMGVSQARATVEALER